MHLISLIIKPKKITKNKILFRGDKYNYVMKFTQRFNILETTLGNLDFIKINSQFFVDLNTHLHHTLKIKKRKRLPRVVE